MMQLDRKILADVSVAELFEEFESNVNDTIAKLSLALDPETKETRTFVVLPMPALTRELFSSLAGLDAWSGRFRGSLPYNHHTRSWLKYRSFADHAFPSTSNKLLWSPLYKYLEVTLADSGKTVRARVSRRTFVRGRTSEQVIVQGINRLQRNSENIPTFRALIQLLDPSAYDQIFTCSDALRHPAIEYLCEGLYRADLGLQSVDGLVRGFHQQVGRYTPDLVMKIKLYVNRADFRAYYVDKNVARHLSGAILQGIFGGPSVRVRRQFDIEATYPAVGKNILHYSVSVPKDDHFLIIINGDISSFTNSCVNSWIFILTMLVQLLTTENVRHLNAPFIVNVKGRLLETVLSDVMWSYLVLTVGAVSTLASGTSYIAPGGYLGVTFNNLATMIAFCFLLEELAVKVTTMFHGCRIIYRQVGGDDFHLMIDAPSRLLAYECWTFVRAQIETYIGYLKDPVVNEVSPQRTDSWILDGEFCKKKLLVRTSVTDNLFSITVQSRQKLPLLSALITLETVTSTKRKRLLMTYDKQLSRFFERYRNRDMLRTVFLTAICRFQSVELLKPVTCQQMLIRSTNLVWIDGNPYTRSAIAMMQSVRSVISSKGYLFLFTGQDKAVSLVQRELLQLDDVHVDSYDVDVQKVFHTFSDRRFLERRRSRYQPSFEQAPACFDQFVDDVMFHLRSTLNVLFPDCAMNP